MKFLIALAVLVAIAAAAPQNDGGAQILRSDSDVGVNSYKFE